MGVQEHYISSARAAANTGWVLCATLMTLAWAIAWLDPADWMVSALLAMTSVLAAIVAATMQIRLYVVKVCSLIRRTSGLSTEDGGNVHAMR